LSESRKLTDATRSTPLMMFTYRCRRVAAWYTGFDHLPALYDQI
jgi:hypothetical protein